MAKKANVSVTWETIQDGKTRVGAHLKGILVNVLQDGYILEVNEMPGVNRTFENANDFSDWFDSIGS